MERLSDMNSIHDNKVNNTAECNLLYHIIYYFKRTKYININYSPILHICMSTRRFREDIYI